MSRDIWNKLHTELAQWESSGQRLSLWWRDDDAVASTKNLERLITLSQKYSLPVSLAVIPASLEKSLSLRLQSTDKVTCMLHGYSHSNHSSPDMRKQELSPLRSTAETIAELEMGHNILRDAFGQKYIAVLVPPWNRIAPAFIPELHNIGLHGLSTLGARQFMQPPSSEVILNNVHVDIINWKTRTYAGDGKVLNQLLDHLAAQRNGDCDSTEVTGIMTHHLVHDDACWSFLDRFFSELSHYRFIQWPSPAGFFGS